MTPIESLFEVSGITHHLSGRALKERGVAAVAPNLVGVAAVFPDVRRRKYGLVLGESGECAAREDHKANEALQGKRPGAGRQSPTGVSGRPRVAYLPRFTKQSVSRRFAVVANYPAPNETKGSIYMRFKARGVLFALVAAFAISAVAAASASAALPEFKPATKQAFAETSNSSFSIEGGFELPVTCTKLATVGEITGASTLGSVVMKMTGCTSYEGSVGGPVCHYHSEGAKEGEIVTGALTGELGEVKTSEAASGVGVLLKPASGKQTWATVTSTCSGNNALDGSIAAEVTPVKTSTKSIKLGFAGGLGEPKIKTITVKGGVVKPKLWGLYNEAENLSFATTTETLAFPTAFEVT